MELTQPGLDEQEREMVELTLPASPRHATVARLVTASLAADAGFDVDEIDDMRLGINEAFAVLTDAPATESTDLIRIEFFTSPGHIEVLAQRTNGPPVPPPDDLAVRILSVVLDHHEFAASTFRLIKHSTSGHTDDGD